VACDINGRSSAQVHFRQLSPHSPYTRHTSYIHRLRACGVMSSRTTIHQREILGGPRSAVVRNYSFGAIGKMGVDFCAALPGPSFAVGVSIELASEGPDIRTLALATQDQVFVLSFQPPPSPTQREALAKLLKIQYLTGFEMPYTIVLLAHALGSDVAGYDLSTQKLGYISTPGDFINSKNVYVSARTINELWDGGIPRSDANSSGMVQPNYAVRAWFTAMCVTLTPLAFIDPPSLP
jgi:hypothetical protein